MGKLNKNPRLRTIADEYRAAVLQRLNYSRLDGYSGFPPLPLREWHHMNEMLVGVSSVIFNSLLFVIVIHEHNQALRPYARLLLQKSRLISGKEMAHILVFPIGYAVMEASALTASLVQEDDNRTRLCPILLDHPLWWHVAEGDPCSPVFTCMISDSRNPFLLTFIGSTLFMILAIYYVMAHYGILVYRIMKTSTFSAKTTQMQRQMNWMLLTQTIVPLFTSIIPVTLMMVFPFFKINIPGSGIIISMCISWVPLVSPVTTIIFVANFRRRAIHYFFFYSPTLQRTLGGPNSSSCLGTSGRASAEDLKA